MGKQRATALTNPELIDQLCDRILAKLREVPREQLPSKQWVVSSSLTRDATKLTRATAYDKIADFCHRQSEHGAISCQRGEFDMTKLSEALTAYCICATSST